MVIIFKIKNTAIKKINYHLYLGNKILKAIQLAYPQLLK